MARMRITLVLLLALAAGGSIAYGTYSYMQNVQVKTVFRCRPDRWSWRPPTWGLAPRCGSRTCA